MASGDDRIFRFEGFTLDLWRGSLLGPDGEIELRPKALEVLRYLVGNPARLIRKDEVIAAVWPNVVVTDASLTQCVSEIRVALGDSQQRIIRTAARRGYLFEAAVVRSDAPGLPPVTATAGERPAADEPPGADPLATMAAPEPAGEAEPTAHVAAPRSAERRQLTVLACEWVGLAALAVRLDPEDLRTTVAAYHRRCAEVVERHHGFLARTLDDGALFYFGYPAASEHDAEHAVRAGLELLAGPPFSDPPEAGDRQGQAAGAGEAAPALRIGVASGIVVIDHDVVEGSRLPAAMGAAPHVARRLVAAAPVGGLLIDQGTRRLVGGWFEYRPAESVVLDQHAEPITTWGVTARSPIESRFEALREGALAAMVGRDEEADLLLRRWQRARTGDGQVVLICGEPGIGKSRLAAALLDRIANDRSARLRYFCSPDHTRSALHPILRQLETAAGVTAGDDAAARSAKLAELLARAQATPDDHAALAELLGAPMPGHSPGIGLPPQQRRKRILDAIMRRFEAEAHQPLFAVFEDVQWIDPTSLDVLGRMVDRIARLPALLIATFRPELAPPWIGAPHVTLLMLNRLTCRDCRDLIAGVAQGRLLPDPLVDEIVARSDGVPLFAEELTRSALDTGALAAPGTVAPAGQVPASLGASLTARLDRLGPARELAQIGAVIGRAFSYDALAAVAGCDATELTSSLERLVEAGLVLREGQPPDASFLFKHALIQDAAYGTLLREARRELHARIATTFEVAFPHIRASEPEILARHYHEAGLLPQAVGRWGEAGDLALRRSAVQEALAHLGRAIEVADRATQDGTPLIPGGARLKLQLAYGQALMWARDMPPAIAAYARARELAAQLQNPAERFSAYHGLWAGTLMRADFAAATEISATFLNDTQAGAGPIDLAGAHRGMGTTLWHRAEFTPARTHLEQALALNDSADDCEAALRFGPEIGAAVSVLLGAALWISGDLGRARTHLDAALARATESGHVLTLVYVLMYEIIIELTRGDAERVMALIQRHVELCREYGLTHIVYAELGRAPARWRMGEREGILAEMRRAAAQLPEYYRLGIPWSLSLLADIEMRTGELDASLLSIDAAIREAGRTGEHWYMAESHRLRGDILLARDPADTAAAEQAFGNALATAQQQQARSFALRAALSLAKLHVAGGRNGEAQDVLAPALAGFAPTAELPEIADAQALLAGLASEGAAPRRRPAERQV